METMDEMKESQAVSTHQLLRIGYGSILDLAILNEPFLDWLRMLFSNPKIFQDFLRFWPIIAYEQK